MHFKRLELHGFKSFAEPASFDFTEGMTCVVGPNGSGKSNIADAIKWVLGEQSAKNLRGGKMEEVIFAGTSTRKPRGIAEVTLIIDNQDQSLPLEYTEVAITRKMYRSGESEYYINRRPCRMKDIKELIMDTGIGVEGYSLISQGRISEIVNNKAEGRRELFEEAAGIVKYRTRKKEAQRKLTAASANLDRVNDIIAEIEGRIDGLKNDSDKAEEYIGLRDKYRFLEINLAVRQAESLDSKLEGLREEVRLREAETADYEEQLRQNNEKFEKARAEEALYSSEAEIKSSERMALLENISQLKNEIEVANEKLSSYDRDKTRLDSEILRLNREIMEEEAAIEDYAVRRTELNEKKSVLKAKIDEREAIYSKSSDELRKRQDSIEERRSEVFTLHSGIRVGKTEILGLRSLIEGLDRRKAKILEDESESRKTVSEICDANKRILAEEANLTGLKNEYELKLEEARREVESISGKLKENVNSKVEAEKNLSMIKTKLDLLTGFELSYEGFAQAVKFIMSRKAVLGGIRGVVADHIEVPSGFETAIQTALSGSMQNIVCDDDKAASAAVEMLKRERAGRATFLPIRSINGGKSAAASPDASKLRKETGFIGFGDEVVGYNDEVKGIVTYLLGRTVIADTLENAVKMSRRYKDGIRYVTLEGEVVNPAGAISGGRFKKENTNVFLRKNEIRALEEKNRSLSDEAESLIKSETEIRSELKYAEAAFEQIQRAAAEAEDKLSVLRGELEKNQEREAALQDNIDRWHKEVEEIERESGETLKMINQIEAEVGAKQVEITESEGAVDRELRSLEEDRLSSENILEEITGLRLSAHSIESDLKHISNSEINSRTAIEKLKAAVKTSSAEREETQRLIAETTAKVENAEADLEKSEEKNRDLINKINDLKSKKEAAEAERTVCEDFNKETGEKLSIAKTAVYDIQIKLARSEAQSEAVKNSLWENFEVTFPEAQTLKAEPFAVTSAARESREIRSRMKELEPVNIGAIEEYKQVSERLVFLNDQRNDLNEAAATLTDVIKDMDKIITNRFLESFDEIGTQFKKTFIELFGGGVAELKLENYDDVLESTIEIVAQPPGKKLQNINLLSGGEKSLTAIALLCAILKVRPTPFCILDEVEAALDEANIDRFVDYIRAMEDIQFIVVTHQKATMEKADALYGITMPEKGVSKVVSLRLES